ncbi:MAG: ribonuclease D [Planctomycetes bacterium]|nr:ribonuclease D [Planctomycetota bacterium]
MWRAAGRFAFDTEFIRDDTFEAALCLVQVACDGAVVLIDPASGLDVSPFWNLVTDAAVRKIVHAGKEDFDVCLTATGKPPSNIFDVQIAAGFVGLGYPLSLSRLVQATLHKRIAKGQTLTNWLRRPLTDEQLRYAVEDVVHLPAIAKHLEAELQKTERVAWAAEEFRRLEDVSNYQPPPGERLFRMKGTKNLDPLGLATLERLIEWREQWAREKNRPRDAEDVVARDHLGGGDRRHDGDARAGRARRPGSRAPLDVPYRGSRERSGRQLAASAGSADLSARRPRRKARTALRLEGDVHRPAAARRARRPQRAAPVRLARRSAAFGGHASNQERRFESLSSFISCAAMRPRADVPGCGGYYPDVHSSRNAV